MDIAPLIIPSFFAGLLTFLAPCTLPLVPAYLGFISGSGATQQEAPSRKRVLLNGLFFVIGFSAVFILLGVFAGALGGFLFGASALISRIGGIFVIVFGLMMLGVINISALASQKNLRIPSVFRRGTIQSALVMGITFGSGWTPCVGPVLGSILLLAGTGGSAQGGALLLGIFSLGLAIPFLLVALGLGQAERFIARFDKYLRISTIIGGVFLVILGALLATGNMKLLVSYGYKALQFINYDSIINYL